MVDHHGRLVFLALAVLVVVLGLMSFPGRFNITGKPTETGTSGDIQQCRLTDTLNCWETEPGPNGLCYRGTKCPVAKACPKDPGPCAYEKQAICNYCKIACNQLLFACNADCADLCKPNKNCDEYCTSWAEDCMESCDRGC